MLLDDISNNGVCLIEDIETLIADITNQINSLFWHISFILVIGLGIAFMVMLRGGMFRGLRDTVVSFKKDIIMMHRDGSRVTSFEAFCTGLGTRIGVGNIAGVATAIVTGGPGAVFWMWIFAIIGSASSFMESTLAQIYKEPKEDGGFYGGPAYYASKGLKSRKIGMILAVLTFFTFGIGFVAVQSANASAALAQAFDYDLNTTEFGIIIAGFVGLIIFSGIKGTSRFSAKIVPIMALGWIIFAISSILMNFENIGNAFSMIFCYAFSIESVVGGGLGTAIMVGLKRGIFSNEAGLGSIANVAATADVRHPVKQGILQALGVLFDTLIICTITALVVLTYGSYQDILSLNLSGAPLVQEIVASTALGEMSTYIIAAFMFVFAFTSLLGYYTIAEANIRFINDSKLVITIIRSTVVIITFTAAMLANIGLMDGICDTFMALMAGMNILVVAMLSRKVYACYRDYMAQKKAGIEEPVFHSSSLDDDDGITMWK